jgi:hypothetical protein
MEPVVFCWLEARLSNLKIRSNALALILLLVAIPHPVSEYSAVHAQEPASTGFTVPITPVLPGQEVHPSLYFHMEDIQDLRTRRDQSAYADFWQAIAQSANMFLSTDPAFQDESARPKMAKTLAFWWLMQGDTVARDKAIDALMRAYDGVPQTGEKPYDEIYRATWLQNYCAAYDWIYHQLSAEQDSVIRARIAGETRFLRNNLTDGLRMAPRPHNHRSKPAWAICTAALTLSDHPDAADWLEYGLTQANTVTEYQFTEDGIYREGGHYWVYSAVNFIPFLWHYWNVSAVNLFPFYEPAFTWPVIVRTGQGWIPNFEDSNVKPAPTHLVAAAYVDTPTDLHSEASLANILQWNYWTANVFTPSYTGATNDVTWEIDNFILYDSSIESIAPDCHPTIKLDGGQIVFRNRWEGGEGHRYMVFHGPSPGDNHNHPDQLSFVIEANSGFVMPDAGYGPDGFSDDRRNTWYVTSKAHNIITANYYAPMYIPAEVTPPTPYFITSHFFSFAEKQMAFAVFPGLTQRRGIAFIGEDYWIVTDILEGASAELQYRSYLHGRGDFSRNGNQASWTSPLNRYGTPVKMDVFLFPSDMNIQEDTGYISMFWDEGAYTYLTMTQQAVNTVFMEVLFPGSPDSAVPAVTDVSGVEYQAAEILKEDTADFVLLQGSSGNIEADNVTTDGNFFWTRSSGGVLKHIAFREATSVSVGGEIDIYMDLPATLAADLSDPQVLTLLIDLPNDTLTMEVSWPQGQNPPTSVIMNSTNIPFSMVNDSTMMIVIAPDISTSVRQITSPESEHLLFAENYPNPFNSQTRIRFKAGYPGDFIFELYNVRGQRIWEIVFSLQKDLQKEIFWNGCDRSGNAQPSGIYFGRFRDIDSRHIKRVKLMLIR